MILLHLLVVPAGRWVLQPAGREDEANRPVAECRLLAESSIEQSELTRSIERIDWLGTNALREGIVLSLALTALSL